MSCSRFVHSRVRVSGAAVLMVEAAARRIIFLQLHPHLGVVSGGVEECGGVVSRRSVGSGELVPLDGVGVMKGPMPCWAFVLQLSLGRGGVFSVAIDKLVWLCRWSGSCLQILLKIAIATHGPCMTATRWRLKNQLTSLSTKMFKQR